MAETPVEMPEKAKLQRSNPDEGDSRPKLKVKELNEVEFTGRLMEAWESRERADLKARHSVGRLLNLRYGHPKKRQPYGDKAIERLKTEAGLSAPEISRLRWFAAFGKSVGVIQEEYPHVVSWTAFKKALPKMKSDKGFKPREAVEETQVLREISRRTAIAESEPGCARQD